MILMTYEFCADQTWYLWLLLLFRLPFGSHFFWNDKIDLMKKSPNLIKNFVSFIRDALAPFSDGWFHVCCYGHNTVGQLQFRKQKP